MAIQIPDEFPIKFYSTLISANFLQEFYYYWPTWFDSVLK